MSIGMQQVSPVHPVQSGSQNGVEAANNKKSREGVPQSPAPKSDTVKLSPAAQAQVDANHNRGRK
jgi:hypothetical protein